MLDYLLIFTTLVLFVISVMRVGLFPFPTVLILFFAVSQLMLLLVHDGEVLYAMHNLYDFGGVTANYDFVQLLYTASAAIALFSLAGKFEILKSLDSTGTLGLLLKAKNSSRFLSSALILLLCSVHFVLFLLLSDWDSLWFYPVYLDARVDPQWVAVFGEEFSDTIMRTAPLFSILSCLAVCRLIGTRHILLKTIAIVLTVCYFLIVLSQHSRAAAFVPVLLAINFALLRLKGRRIVVPVMAFVAAITLLGVLAGRETDQHGLSVLPETILSPFISPDPIDNIAQSLMDFCQGTVVTAESLQVTGTFDRMYKILAFSPLPSFIDGYASIRADSEHRLHDYVPMSGVGEAFNFGWFYVCLLVAGLTILVRAHVRIAQINPAIFILCNFLIMFSVYMLFSYPLRNALRYYWIAVALFIVVDFARRRALKTAHDTAGRGREQMARPRSFSRVPR
jgi:hypothetical protein